MGVIPIYFLLSSVLLLCIPCIIGQSKNLKSANPREMAAPFGKITHYNLQLPNTCAKPDGLICLNNKCRIRIGRFPSFIATCDNDWIVIQRRMNGSVGFNRNWTDYKNGFGDLNGEFWLGLEKIHTLISSHPFELRIKLIDSNGVPRYIDFTRFRIAGENKKYVLEMLGSRLGYFGIDLLMQDTKFSTFDEDNDKSKNKNCAEYVPAGRWFHTCARIHENSPNGQYFIHQPFQKDGILWIESSEHLVFKFVQMSIRRIK